MYIITAQYRTSEDELWFGWYSNDIDKLIAKWGNADECVRQDHGPNRINFIYKCCDEMFDEYGDRVCECEEDDNYNEICDWELTKLEED